MVNETVDEWMGVWVDGWTDVWMTDGCENGVTDNYLEDCQVCLPPWKKKLNFWERQGN